MAVERLGGFGGATEVLAPPVLGERQVVSNIGIGRRTYARIPTVLEMPNLVQVQVESFNWFLQEGMRELLEEISPISDHLAPTDPRRR